MAILIEKGLVEEVRRLCADAITQTHAESKQHGGSKKRLRQYIDLTITQGKAFFGFEDTPSAHPLEPRVVSPHIKSNPSDKYSTFRLHVHFRKQRFVSRPVACVCEPQFNETFPLELPSTFSTFLDVTDPIHLVLTRTTAEGTIALIASHQFQWRRPTLECMAHDDTVTKTVELDGVGTSATVPAGALSVQLKVRPSPVLDSQALLDQLSNSRNVVMQKDSLFLAYAKRWWKEFLDIRPSHITRLVKIYAPDETGRSRPICRTVRPLSPGEQPINLSLPTYQPTTTLPINLPLPTYQPITTPAVQPRCHQVCWLTRARAFAIGQPLCL